MKWMNRRKGLYTAVAAITSLLVATSGAPALAKSKNNEPEQFQWVSTFDVMAGNGSEVAEIVDASRDGKQLVYTDSGNLAIGFVDISDPASPRGDGVVAVGGEPTSLAILGSLVLVAVNTAPDFVSPSGMLVVVDRYSREIVAEHALGGQPDSIAISPNRKYAAVVIENERDEDLNDGLLPQLPSGGLLIFDLKGGPAGWMQRVADLSPVAVGAFEGADLEPEFVDINKKNQAVVTFQENNYLAVVDLKSGTTVEHFTAGRAELHNVDTVEDDLLILNTDITKRREPDAVSWVSNNSFATANEGDYEDGNGEEGGSRGFTIFVDEGGVGYASAVQFEHLLVSIGHYNESRSENKGVEPEAVEFGQFGKLNLLFVGSERSNAVAVYNVDKGEPELLQVLPTGMGPEGLKAIPDRDLFVASTEEGGSAEAGIPTMINIYQLSAALESGRGNSKHHSNGRHKGKSRGHAATNSPSEYRYPMISSGNDESGLPIPWVALSGLAADPWNANTLYAVSDSFLAQGFIYTIDVSSQPAQIVERVQVSGASDLDLEGIAVAPDGSFWLGSEGGNPGSRENLVLQVNPATGAVLSEIALPAEMVDERRSNGIEGIAVTGPAGAELVYVAIQRAWPSEGDTDKVNTKIGRYDVASGEWGFVHYPLEAEGGGGWIGLSEITALPGGNFAVIERDKGWGPTTGLNAELKSLFEIDLASAEFRSFDDPAGLVLIDKSEYFDVLPLLEKNSVWTAEKLEGFAVTADGREFVVTDNDGVDEAPGETVFLQINASKKGR